MRHNGARGWCRNRFFTWVLFLCGITLCPIGAPARAQAIKMDGGAEITSVGPINTKAKQTIVIKGQHFGTAAPYNGCGTFLRITDVTSNRVFGQWGLGGSCGGVLVTSWTDTEIDVEGFTSFKQGEDALKVGDMIKIEVANPQQQGWVSSGDNLNGAPLAWYSVRVTQERIGPPTQRSQTKSGAEITSVSPVNTRPSQTIVIKGEHLGTVAPYSGCGDSFLRITNVMNNQVFGQWGLGGSCKALLVTSRTDSEIDVSGFPSFKPGEEPFKVGDMIKIEVANPQQQGWVSSGDDFNGSPVAWYSVRVTPEGAEPLASVAAPPAEVAQTSPPTGAIIIPANTSVLVLMIDSVDSSKNKIGDAFRASLESALVVGDSVVAPKGADVYGKLAQAKSAGKISGGAELTLEMTGIRINGNIVAVDSTDYDVAGKGRGKQSAERIGGGSALGAIIGGIAGGGKGATIGAVTGAGAGTVVQVVTHGQQVRIPSETLLEFKLQQAATVSMPDLGTTGQQNSQAPLIAAVLANGSSIAQATTNQAASTPGSTSTGDIRSVDFRNFGYPSNCRREVNDGFDTVIHVSNGEWKKGDDYLRIVNVAYRGYRGRRPSRGRRANELWHSSELGL